MLEGGQENGFGLIKILSQDGIWWDAIYISASWCLFESLVGEGWEFKDKLQVHES